MVNLRARIKARLSRIPTVESQAISISLVVGVGLFSLKFAAFFLTHSAAIFSDAVESIANVLASTVAFYALVVAHSPADEEHPYGHGKIEFLSAMFEGSMIFLAALFIFVRTIDATWSGELVREQELNLGLGLVALAMLVNGGVGLHLIRTGRKQGSITLEADGRHLMSDALTSIAVFFGLGLVKLTGWRYFDPITAFLISGYITWTALTLVQRSASRLMDRQDQQDVELLTSLLDSDVAPHGSPPHICSYHKLRHRHSGRYHWVDFHLVVPANWTIEQGHAVAGAIEGEIERVLGEGNATAHVEPCTRAECPACRQRASGESE